jgi:hypothetical protein
VGTSGPRCLVLVAGPVIGLHELGIWEAFVTRYEVVNPQTVYDGEASFHSGVETTAERLTIDLSADVVVGRVEVAEAGLGAIADVSARFSGAIELHAGELEALALLTMDADYDEHVFCTGNGAALQGACLLGLAERCESVEGLVGYGGMSREVPWPLSEAFMDKHKREGSARAITGHGLKD